MGGSHAGAIARITLFGAIAAGILLAVWLLSAAPTAQAHPPVPTGPDATASCTTCHGPGGTQPLPADHAGRGPESCTTCHAAIAGGQSPTAPSYAQCATCHAAPGAATSLATGEKLSTFVDVERYRTSVHGRLSCTVCHESQAQIPHKPLTAEGRRDFTFEMATICQKCHTDATKSYDDSFHGMAARLGVGKAATCQDCHTAHAVQAPATWSLADRATNCAACHEGADAQFASGWMGHTEPSIGWFTPVFFAEKGFVTLTAGALGFGIVHVELDFLRWIWNRARGKKGA